MGFLKARYFDFLNQNSQPVDLSDTDLILYHEPISVFSKSLDISFALSSRNNSPWNLINAKHHIEDFKNNGMETK